MIRQQKGRINPDAVSSVAAWMACVIYLFLIGTTGRIEEPIIGILVFFALHTLSVVFRAWYLMALGAFGFGIMLFARRGHYIIDSEGHDALSTHNLDPDDPYVHSHALFDVKVIMIAKPDRVTDPARLTAAGSARP